CRETAPLKYRLHLGHLIGSDLPGTRQHGVDELSRRVLLGNRPGHRLPRPRQDPICSIPAEDGTKFPECTTPDLSAILRHTSELRCFVESSGVVQVAYVWLSQIHHDGDDLAERWPVAEAAREIIGKSAFDLPHRGSSHCSV